MKRLSRFQGSISAIFSVILSVIWLFKNEIQIEEIFLLLYIHFFFL